MIKLYCNGYNCQPLTLIATVAQQMKTLLGSVQ